MQKVLFLFQLSLFSLFLNAGQYRVFARDKGPNEHAGNWLDQPFHPAYLDSLRIYGADIIGCSKWLNLAYVEADSCAIEKIARLHFIKEVSEVNSGIKVHSSLDWLAHYNMTQSHSLVNNGMAGPQLEMHNIHKLHHNGYTGKGVRIALFDGGFYKVDSLRFFNKLFKKGQIIATKDFHDSIDNVYDDNWHGMSVLSTISCDSPGVFMGAAYEASFLLARTEVTYFEKHIEELYYLRAMEWADSIGVDIIHASLGYVVFDSAEGDYQYEHMDGNTTIITRAADIAASRGIIVTNSAGNLGAHVYGKITAPCDGDSVLCVGAVDMNGYIAPFSSRGPSADGRVKPDVVATGNGVIVVDEKDSLRFSGGTSFSGPIIAGLAACLKQAHPQRSNMEIIHAIRESSDRYRNPNITHGYGIPDGMKAHLILRNMDHAGDKFEVLAYPNPGSPVGLYLPYSGTGLKLRIYEMHLQFSLEVIIPEGIQTFTEIGNLAAGIYVVEVTDGKRFAYTKLLIQ